MRCYLCVLQCGEDEEEHDVPIVIVGNKVDVGDEKRTLGRATAESIVCVEWGNGYVEASAKVSLFVHNTATVNFCCLFLIYEKKIYCDFCLKSNCLKYWY
jgi:GTPase SAR1 family protein